MVSWLYLQGKIWTCSIQIRNRNLRQERNMKKKHCTESVVMFGYLNVWMFIWEGLLIFLSCCTTLWRKHLTTCVWRDFTVRCLLILWFSGFFQCISCLIPDQTHSFSSRCDSGTSPFAFLHKLFTKFDWQWSSTPLSDLTAFWLKENVAAFQHLPLYANPHHCISSLWQTLLLEWSYLLYYTEKQQGWGGVAHNLSYYLVVNANNQDIHNSTGESW